jgi:hypothetical protein
MRPDMELAIRGDDHQDVYGVRAQTTRELQHTGRQLRANLALVTPTSPACVPILSHMDAVSAELDRRADIHLDDGRAVPSCA